MTKYYVSMTDEFLSGWGKANGKINKLVIECDNYKEVEAVISNAEYRDDMKNIKVVKRKPSYDSSQYLVSHHDKNDYAEWFIPNYFANKK